MKFFALRFESTGRYIKNLYTAAYHSTRMYVVSSEDILKCKRYKTFKAASKVKDRLDAYYESEGITSGRDIVIVEVEINIKLRDL